MKATMMITIFLAFVFTAAFSLARHESRLADTKETPVVYVSMGDTGDKTRIDKDLYVTYDFNKKPSMGMVIVKVQVFNREGKKITGLAITGDSGMPSMRGAHDSGEMLFKLNKKGDYLLPVNIVMPGDWEIKVKFMKDKKVIFSGKIEFDV